MKRGIHGFEDVLTKWLRGIQPQHVMEWGPGFSTEVILRECPHALVTSVEHDDTWFATAKERFGDKIQLIQEDYVKRNSSYAACAYDHKPYIDLAFVDGRRRLECVMIALSILRPGGVVILHDWNRQNYSKPLGLLARVIEVADNTAVIQPNGIDPKMVPSLTQP